MAPRAEERRDKLRKAAGRSTYPIDPQMSEWGNPAEETLRHRALNKRKPNRCTEGTR